MTVTLTYDATLARVRITADGLAAADVALVERSTDLVRWTTVRGGGAVTVTAGAFAETLDDYEFVDGVPNHYRVRGVETGAIAYVGVGAASTAVNASVTPALPGGLVVGDLLVAFASIRNSGAGTVDTPAGWSVIRAFGNAALLGRRYQAGDVAPVITFTDGAANADTTGQVAAWRRADAVPVTGADQLNASAQDIATPALTVPADDLLLIAAAWKQDDWTSVAPLDGWTEIAETATTTGDDAGQVWDYLIQTTAANVTAASIVVTGGAAAASRAAVVAMQHAAYLNSQTDDITPDLGGQIWLKSIARPFLNRSVAVVDWSSIERPDSGADFAVVNRSLGVGITDVRAGRRWTMQLKTPTAADRQTLDFILASGDVLFVHVPDGCQVPGGYVRVATTSERRTTHLRGNTRVFSLPLIEQAPPGPDVVGATATWASVLAAYATWADVLAAHATWADLLTLIGDPSEVIVS